MTLDDRTEWLTIAADEVADVPGEVLIAACRAARKTCDHPAKLIPAILAYAEEHVVYLRAAVRREIKPKLVQIAPPVSEIRPSLPPMTQADVDGMPDYLQNLGVAAGWLSRETDGRVLLVREDD